MVKGIEEMLPASEEKSTKPEKGRITLGQLIDDIIEGGRQNPARQSVLLGIIRNAPGKDDSGRAGGPN